MYRPLADRVRPAEFEDMVGQEAILGKNGFLRRILASGSLPNMIFYGPSGTGKTTAANIIAEKTSRKLFKLNATTAGVADIKQIISEVDTLAAMNGILLYLDEIQYFNKKQQQSLLEFIENGKITLIASTTENPYFYVYGAILSRSTVFEFKPVSTADVKKAVMRALKLLETEYEREITLEDGVAEHIAAASGGDVRKAMNALEALAAASAAESADGRKVHITLSDALIVSQRSANRFDRDGDSHYDLLSAFQKSIRGSDPDAALHYLARILDGGDMISAIRRLIVTAAEDVGLAYPQAMSVVMACVAAAEHVGLPEAQIPLAEAVLLCATAPKSNSAAEAIGAAMNDVKNGKIGDIPPHLKDSHYAGAAKLGHGVAYKYPHAFPNNYVAQQYLPDALAGTVYYKEGSNKNELSFRRYWEDIKERND